MFQDIYNFVKRWQGKVNSKDPLTYEIIRLIRNVGKQMHKDNYYEALADWLDVIMIEGYRGVEWCHHKWCNRFGGCRNLDVRTSLHESYRRGRIRTDRYDASA